VAFAAPEVLFNDVLSPACDIWSLGCLVFLLIGDRYLWSSLFNTKEEVFRQWAFAFGRLPDRWWRAWETKDRKKLLDDAGCLLVDMPEDEVFDPPLLPIELHVVDVLRVDGMGSEEFEQFGNLMRKVFKLEQAERVNAEEFVKLLPSAWLTGGRKSV
jgi:serine/threonine protein kinase